MQDSVKNDGCGCSRERNRPSGHLIEHYPERKQIRPCVQLFSTSLFRRHVGDRAHGASGVSQLLAMRHMRDRVHGTVVNWFGYVRLRRRKLGQTKIQYFGLGPLHQKYVRGLDVTVNDSLRVRRIQAAGNLNTNFQQLAMFRSASR